MYTHAHNVYSRNWESSSINKALLLEEQWPELNPRNPNYKKSLFLKIGNPVSAKQIPSANNNNYSPNVGCLWQSSLL